MVMKKRVSIHYHIKLYGQPTNMTCWSAATTMLLGTNMSIGSGTAKTGKGGGLKPDYQKVTDFAKSHNLRVYPMQSHSVEGLISIMQSGPVAMFGALPSLHAVVIGGITSDGSTLKGTELTIYDPWPPRQGKIYKMTYDDLMTKFPLATMYLLQA